MEDMSAMDFQNPEVMQVSLQLSPFWRCNVLRLVLQFSAIKLCNKYTGNEGGTKRYLNMAHLTMMMITEDGEIIEL